MGVLRARVGGAWVDIACDHGVVGGAGPTEERWGTAEVTTDANGSAQIFFNPPFPVGHTPMVLAWQDFNNVIVGLTLMTNASFWAQLRRADGSLVTSLAISVHYRAWWPAANPV